MEQSQFDHIKGAVEALLFVSEKPVSLDQFKEAISGAQTSDFKEVLLALEKEYEIPNKGMIIVEIANGWQMLSSGNFAGYVREFYKTRHKEKLSRPSLETLAIIAYKQPVSRMDVEIIRGVNSDGVVMHLLNKGLIKIAGRKEVPGRPYVYGTTVQFLEYFGLRSIEDLPKLEEFPALMQQANEVQPTANLQAESVITSGPVLGEGAQKDEHVLNEELAKARTRLDIDELERQNKDNSESSETAGLGESSGQARLMGASDAGEDVSEREAQGGSSGEEIKDQP